jgi:hypothetical protein
MEAKTPPYFKINLHGAWVEKGKPTLYRMNLDTGVARQTIATYIAEEGAEVDALSSAVISLCQYFGVKWEDVVEIIEGMPFPA